MIHQQFIIGSRRIREKGSETSDVSGRAMARWQHAFISYAHHDQSITFNIADALERCGVQVWIDRSIDGGVNWSEEIARSIIASRAVVLIASSISLTRPVVKKEINLASAEHKTIIPCFIEETHIPDDLKLHLAGCNWILLHRLPPSERLPSLLRALYLAGVAVPSCELGDAVSPIAHAQKRFIEPCYSRLRAMTPAAVRRKLGELQQVLEVKPDHGYAHLNTGLLYLHMQNFEAAENSFRRACQFIPEEPDAYYFLALSLCRGKRLGALIISVIREIETHLNTALQLDPEREVYHYLRAVIIEEYFEANGLRHSPPTLRDSIALAKSFKQNPEEIDRLLATVSIRSPSLQQLILR